MDGGQTTCWTLIEAAAAGADRARDDFARRYEPVVRAYLAARWAAAPGRAELDDAVQEVFLECFRERGVLQQADPGRPGGFRAFLYGVSRNVALRCETRRARRAARDGADEAAVQRAAADEDRLSQAFDRAWAVSVMRAAAERMSQAACEDEEALRRVELLRLRFQEDRPIREIAAGWGVDAVHVHRQYARARREFRAALLEVLTFHRPDRPDEVERECAELLGLLA